MTSQLSAKVSSSPKIELGESRTNLIINYLPQTMNQEEVRALFSSIGEIESCKLVRDKMTGQSLGYGFVNYVKDDDASRAVASFNGLRLQNKTIKVSFARPSAEGIKGANLYVSGLPKSMTQRELERLFRPYGQIITSRILSDNITGLSKGVGFVRFDKRHEAENAIEKLNGATPDGCVDQITVKFANNPANNPTKNALQEATTIAAASTLLNPFASLTTPTSSPRVLPITGCGPIRTATTRGAFRFNPLTPTLPMASPCDLLTTQALLQMSAGLPATNLASTISPLLFPTATAVPSTSSSSYVLIQNLSPETDETVLWAFFTPFGTVASVKVLREMSTAKSKGVGIVAMSTYEEAVTAASTLNGSKLAGRTLQIREIDRSTVLALLAQEQPQPQPMQSLYPSLGLSWPVSFEPGAA